MRWKFTPPPFLKFNDLPVDQVASFFASLWGEGGESDGVSCGRVLPCFPTLFFEFHFVLVVFDTQKHPRHNPPPEEMALRNPQCLECDLTGSLFHSVTKRQTDGALNIVALIWKVLTAPVTERTALGGWPFIDSSQLKTFTRYWWLVTSDLHLVIQMKEWKNVKMKGYSDASFASDGCFWVLWADVSSSGRMIM